MKQFAAHGRSQSFENEKKSLAPDWYQPTNNIVTEVFCVTVFQMAKASVTTAYEMSSASKQWGRTLNASRENAPAREDPSKPETV